MNASPRAKLLEDLLARRILLLDGAMGTMIQNHKLNEADYRGERFAAFPHDLKGNNDLLTLTQPQIIRSIHEAYLEAGSDIIETNTFNSTAASMSDYHMQDLVYELNFAGAKLAKEAARLWKRNATEAALCRGSAWAHYETASISPDVNDPGFRVLRLRPTGRRLYRICSWADRRRRDSSWSRPFSIRSTRKAALFAIDQFCRSYGCAFR